MSTATEPAPRADHRPGAPVPRDGIGALLRRLHFYAGVLVAPFLIVTALTGLAYAFAPQLDQLFYGDELRVEQSGQGTLPLTEQIAAARHAHPEGTVASVVTPADRDETTQVVLSVPEELGEELRRTVYVDPYTGEVTGALATSSGSTPLTTWLAELHGNLLLGDVGALYSETAASWLWILVLGGGALWLRRVRGRRAGSLRGALLPDRTARGVRRSRSRHTVLGVWLATGLLFLSATGLTWSQYAGSRFDALLTWADARAPAVDTSLSATGRGYGHGEHDEHDDEHEGHAVPGEGGVVGDRSSRLARAAGRVLASARAAGLDGPVELTPPEDPKSAWTVAQDDEVWPVRLDTVAVDAGTGEITDRSDFTDHPLPAKLSTFGIQAHMGRLFGLANQFALAAVAVGLLAAIGYGYRMWWQRRPTRTDRRAPLGAPPSRGAWRRLPKPVLLVGLPALGALCWALPVFGVTLAGFLVFDVAVGLVRRCRPGAAPDAG